MAPQAVGMGQEVSATKFAGRVGDPSFGETVYRTAPVIGLGGGVVGGDPRHLDVGKARREGGGGRGRGGGVLSLCMTVVI